MIEEMLMEEYEMNFLHLKKPTCMIITCLYNYSYTGSRIFIKISSRNQTCTAWMGRVDKATDYNRSLIKCGTEWNGT